MFARIYARLSGPMEHGGMANYRDCTLAGLSARVLEVGAGDGAVQRGRSGPGTSRDTPVLRPGGELRFFEHVRAESAPMRAVQRTLDATVWPLVAGGCHTGRDTQAAIEATGFQITELDALRFPDVRVSTPVTRHLLGAAIRP